MIDEKFVKKMKKVLINLNSNRTLKYTYMDNST